MEKMKTRLLIIITLSLVPLILPNVSAACAAEAMEWWEPCNDAGQNDILSFKATLIIVILAIIGIAIIFFVIRRKRK